MDNLVVCVPCYNAVDWIEDCLASIQSQNPTGGQKVVVGDDCSDDGTFELLKQLCDKYDFELFRTDKPRRGPYWIVNRIMEEYPAAFYQTVDADDMLCEGATDKILALMDVTGAQIGAGQCEYIEEDKTPAPEQRWYACDVSTFAKMVREYAIINSGRILRAEVLEQIGLFDDSYICSMDSDFFFRAADAGIRMRNLPSPTIRVRLHRNGGSLTCNPETDYKSQYRRDISERLYQKYPFYRNFGIGFVRFFHHEIRLQQFSVPLMLYFEHYLGCWLTFLGDGRVGKKSLRMRGDLRNGIFGFLAARQLAADLRANQKRVCVIGPEDRLQWFGRVCADLVDEDKICFIDACTTKEQAFGADCVVMLSEGSSFGFTPDLLESVGNISSELCGLPWSDFKEQDEELGDVREICQLADKVETTCITDLFDFFYKNFNDEKNLRVVVAVMRELVGRYILKYFQREPNVCWPMIQSGVFGPGYIRRVTGAYEHEINLIQALSWDDWAVLYKYETQSKASAVGLYLRNIVLGKINSLKHARVAFYGAGQHARWMLECFGDDLKTCDSLCMLDDNAVPEQKFCGLEVAKTDVFDFSTVDLVVIASDTFEPQMYATLCKLCEKEKIFAPYAVVVKDWKNFCAERNGGNQ